MHNTNTLLVFLSTFQTYYKESCYIVTIPDIPSQLMPYITTHED